MDLLLSTERLASPGGSETYLLTVAEHLQRLGHRVTLHAEEARPALAADRGLELVVGVDAVPEEVDAIIVQDAINAYALAERLPEVPQLFVAHSALHDVQLPPQLPDARPVAVAMNERVRRRLESLAVVPRVERLCQPVDLDVFAPHVAPRPEARRLLALGHRLRDDRRALLADVCAELGLELDVAGGAQPTTAPWERIAAADIVVGIGRCIVEAMAAGRAAYVWDHMGGDGWVRSGNYARLESDGFNGLAGAARIDRSRLLRDLSEYTPEMGLVNRDLAVRFHDPRVHAERLVELLRDAAGGPGTAPGEAAELARLTRVAWEAERRSIDLSRRVEQLSAELRDTGDAAARDRQRAQEEAARAGILEAELLASHGATDALKATRRYRLAGALARPLDRARLRRRGRVPAPPLEPADGPELAVVVFTLGAQPSIVRAVRSLLAQEVPLEIVVVNSGGGDAGALLAEAGIEGVRVVGMDERLFPGAACNLGLRHTSAPFVKFMAGDLEVQPGWAAGRLRRHRAGVRVVAEAIVPSRPVRAAGLASYLSLYYTRTPATPPERAQCFGLSYDRTLFDRCGLFREDLRTGEDTDMRARFADEVEIVFAPDVQAAHDFPARARDLVRDHYMRGRRMAYAYAYANGWDLRTLIARNAARGIRPALLAGLRSGRGLREKALVVPAAPLLLAGVAAYALGGRTAPLRPRRRRRGPRRRVLALLQFKDEMRYLPGYFENLAGQLDGVIALDDGSTDGSAEYVAGRPEVVELLRAEGGAWDEAANRERLVRAALRHDADWLLAIDADERVEREFRARAEQQFDIADVERHTAYFVHIREVWDRPDRIRVDGFWGRKHKAALFRPRADHAFDPRALHGQWAPLNDHPDAVFPQAAVIVYHLRMLHAADREARRARYERLDPERRWQEQGYGYLTDTAGLTLAPLPLHRDYVPAPPPAPEPAAVPGEPAAPLPLRGEPARPRARRRLLALLPFKDEMRHLPELFENVADHVDGVVALDDGSTDGSAEFVAARPEVLELLRREQADTRKRDALNHERLVRAAWEHGADWLLGIDADERVEQDFRARAERELDRADAEAISAYFVKWRHLWDRRDQVRVDGVLGAGRKAILFRARRDHRFDPQFEHGHWAPLNDYPDGEFPQADLIVYHLGMLTAAGRRRHYEHYLARDPHNLWEPTGYEYLMDETGLVVASLPKGRGFEPLMSASRVA